MRKGFSSLVIALGIAACTPTGKTVEGVVAARLFDRAANNRGAAAVLMGGMAVNGTAYFIDVKAGDDIVLVSDTVRLTMGNRVKAEVGKCYNMLLLETKERGGDWERHWYWLCYAENLQTEPF